MSDELPDTGHRHFAHHDKDGKIVQVSMCSYDQEQNHHPLPGHTLVRLPDASHHENLKEFLKRHHVHEGAVRERDDWEPVFSTEQILADGRDEAVISGLPPGCKVTIGGAVEMPEFAVDDGELVITATHPGLITITVTAPKHHEKVLQVNARQP